MKDNRRKSLEKLKAACEVALEEITKVLSEELNSKEVDPEKVKISVQGKSEASAAAMKLIQQIEEIENLLEDDTKEKDSSDKQDTGESEEEVRRFTGPEGRNKSS